MDSNPTSARAGRLLVGLIFIAGGVAFTLANFNILHLREAWRYWPLVLVGIGLLRFASHRWFAGFVLTALGVLLQLRELDLIWFRLSWLFPLIFVVVGLRIVTQGFRQKWPPPSPGADASGTINEWAVFGGGDRRISVPFAGGQANAVFGGFNLDLRKSTMVGDAATIDLFCFCGGGEVRVPEDWNVSLKVVSIFGGTDDRSRHDLPEGSGTPRKTLVLTGFIVFGGIGVKN